MIHAARWKLALMTTAHLYLHGGDPKVIRGIVKHLNVLYNTQFATCPELEQSVLVLELLTKKVDGSFDHYGDEDPLSPEVRMTYIEMQLISVRHL